MAEFEWYKNIITSKYADNYKICYRIYKVSVCAPPLHGRDLANNTHSTSHNLH